MKSPLTIAIVFMVSSALRARVAAKGGENAARAAPKTASEALRELETPLPLVAHFNAPIIPNSERLYLLDDLVGTGYAAINFLVGSEGVDKELLQLATSSKPLGARIRAAHILIQRRNADVAPVLERMIASDNDDERYVACEAYEHALRDKLLPTPTNFSDFIAAYKKETDSHIRERFELFFAEGKAKSAVKPLLETLKRNPGQPRAIWALGMIGDPSAVPAIIEDFHAQHCDNKGCNVTALGRLATPEAVDFIIAHLDEHYAPEALCQSKSKKALPALQMHLRTLEKRDSKDEINLAATKIAIAQLSQEDCRDALLQMAEDKDEVCGVRASALRVLRENDTTPFKQRILKLYKTDASSEVRSNCYWLLKDADLDGLTEAMIGDALSEDSLRDDSFRYRESSLLEALNNRLRTSYREMADLRAYLKQRGCKPTGRNRAS
jgi:HEAT repeat protein